jgi:hypothetical protein
MHDLLDAVTAKRDLSANQMVHGDPDRPNINLFVVFFEDDLRSHVSWCSDSSVQNFFRLDFGGNAEVYQLYFMRVSFLEKYVLRLYVSMNYTHIVQIHDSS